MPGVIEVFACGTPVSIKYGIGLHGVITGVCVRGAPPATHITYEVSYQSGTDVAAKWFSAFEIDVKDRGEQPRTMGIGFTGPVGPGGK